MKKVVLYLQNRDFFGAQINHIPLLKELRDRYPDSKIYIFSKHKISAILKSLNLADEIVFEKSKIDTFLKYLKINPSVTINLRKKSSFINLYISLLNFNTKIGFETPLTKRFFTSVKKHNPNIYRAKNYLNLFDSKLDAYKTNSVKRVTIIPGAGGEFKIWDIENYILLADRLKKRYSDYEISFILGEKEKNFKDKLSNKNFKIYYNLEINQLFKTISESELTIANDCGPSHIAQISNNSHIILYSDEKNDANTVIREWFNDKKNSHFLIGEKNKSINTIKVDEVFNLAKNVLDGKS